MLLLNTVSLFSLCIPNSVIKWIIEPKKLNDSLLTNLKTCDIIPSVQRNNTKLILGIRLEAKGGGL